MTIEEIDKSFCELERLGAVFILYENNLYRWEIITIGIVIYRSDVGSKLTNTLLEYRFMKNFQEDKKYTATIINFNYDDGKSWDNLVSFKFLGYI